MQILSFLFDFVYHISNEPSYLDYSDIDEALMKLSV